MQVFLCWSGKASHAIAKALHNFLGDTIQELKPFLSSEDIGKGARWRSDVGQQLAECNFGILCMTKENLDSRWILFEAGALSKLPSAHVTALLAGIEWKDVVEPLSQFQHTNITRTDIEALLGDINELLSAEKRLSAERLKRVFDRDWPVLHDKLNAALKIGTTVNPPRRDTSSMITEVLELVRELKRDAEVNKAATNAGPTPWPGYILSTGALSQMHGYGTVTPSAAGPPSGPAGPTGTLYIAGTNQPAMSTLPPGFPLPEPQPQAPSTPPKMSPTAAHGIAKRRAKRKE